ncbi:arylamine N-acetyltransferase [Altererythrobacter sp. CC-YST694]|uniref:arylamine N-acetyltransferase family protein n=1 Tax=Altererythrobacter sp. CC-YST694 TaxID=2755038 RepID=UPI001D017BC8|nr:arylamine N-acetyltransferase [Altererythrobacter sp. CC-YST694]MCB5424357.1 arylamine N-acetyltransferase [Altererythrobacter sp. CC-YST694]
MAGDFRFDLPAYLDRIGLNETSADTAGLRALQAAHMRAVPFENFDPLLGKVPLLGLSDLFGKIVEQRRGGYCFEQNGLFAEALKSAGFSVSRRLARVRMRMGVDGGRSHLALVVEAENRRFLADAGFGGPGPLAPLDLDFEGPQQVPNGTYRLHKDADRAEIVLQRLQAEGWADIYAFDDARVTDGDIANANFVCAVSPEAPFGFHLMFGCYRGDVRYGLFNRSLTVETSDGEERRDLSDLAEFASFLREEAGLGLSDEALERAWAKIAG